MLVQLPAVLGEPGERGRRFLSLSTSPAMLVVDTAAAKYPSAAS
ncbi:MAG TPA: hypothetical protein VFC19_40030 [Candidatus Limnocylindrales bacterium]|nr:hypothetical protein [Candidatus Limnocylindrales bacterium]